jgi:ATP-dependent DNA helicase RecG
MADTVYEVPDINDIDIKSLLNRDEDETFDRTVGGQDSIGRKIAGFGTKHGGILLVGQEDLYKGGEVVGLDDKFQLDFTNAISNVKPTPLTSQRIASIEGKSVAIIRIQDVGTLRPCSYNGVYYERKGHSIHKLTPDEVKQYHLLYGYANAEDIPTLAKKDSIDEAELGEYSKMLGKSKEGIISSVTNNGYLTVRGVIVLAKRPSDHIEGAFIEIQRYDSFIGSSPVPIGPAIKLSKPARMMIEEASAIVEQNTAVTRYYEGAKMVQKPSIPTSVIRETVTNAVAHRNYRSHEHIRIRIYSDGFDISNPAAITSDMWKDIMASQTTYHPNEGIYTFLNPALLFEGRGEGIWKIKDEMKRLGTVAPEFKVIGDGPSSFYVRISLSPARAMDAKRSKLLDFIGQHGEFSTTEVMAKLGVSRATAIVMLNELVEQGLLGHKGYRRSSVYLSNVAKPHIDR